MLYVLNLYTFREVIAVFRFYIEMSKMLQNMNFTLQFCHSVFLCESQLYCVVTSSVEPTRLKAGRVFMCIARCSEVSKHEPSRPELI